MNETEDRSHGSEYEVPDPTWTRTCLMWLVTLKLRAAVAIFLSQAKALNSGNQMLSLCFSKKK